ncbi:MAG: ECF transporter S component [Lachnospirales bacterium]
MKIKNLVYTAILIAMAFILPTITQPIPYLSKYISPMHIPILICGFICGWKYGLIAGFITPLLRGALLGMPPVFPIGVAMAFELATYGAIAGCLYKLLPKKDLFIFITLVSSLMVGRIVYSIAAFFLMGAPNGFVVLLIGTFTSAIFTIILHLIVIPPIILFLNKKGMNLND